MHFNAHWTKFASNRFELIRILLLSHFGYWKRIQLWVMQIILCRCVVIMKIYHEIYYLGCDNAAEL